MKPISCVDVSILFGTKDDKKYKLLREYRSIDSNDMNSIREIEKINQEELDRGIAGTPASWHAQYEKAPWVYVGNLDHELSEGDVLCVMSQYGEVSQLHL